MTSLKMLAVGDSFVTRAQFEAGLSRLAAEHPLRFAELDEAATFTPATSSERSIREYAGTPRNVAAELVDEEVLFVHAAPVTEVVLDASPNLKIVGVARGGPVNVDVHAATERGITVLSAPGRNAEAVADLTLAFSIMLARGVLKGVEFVASGHQLGESNFEGAQFLGHELGGHLLGLIGYGNVGARVAERALAFGMSVLVFDPFVPRTKIERPGVTKTDLDELLSKSDFVSLHARSTSENVDLLNESKFRLMKPGAFFLNTARETLVDEQALYETLVSKRIAGAALDVLKTCPDGSPNPLRSLENVIITPHIGGATFEAALRGVEILAQQVELYASGQTMQHVVNPAAAERTR